MRITEIAELLGVSHQRTSMIVRQPGFLKPVGREGQRRFWDRREVTAWAKKWRREKPGGGGSIFVEPCPPLERVLFRCDNL